MEDNKKKLTTYEYVDGELSKCIKAESLTKEQYDALETKDPNTLYIIKN